MPSNSENLDFYSPTMNIERDPRWGRNDESRGRQQRVQPPQRRLPGRPPHTFNVNDLDTSAVRLFTARMETGEFDDSATVPWVTQARARVRAGPTATPTTP
jgi:beta-glucosidase